MTGGRPLVPVGPPRRVAPSRRDIRAYCPSCGRARRVCVLCDCPLTLGLACPCSPGEYDHRATYVLKLDTPPGQPGGVTTTSVDDLQAVISDLTSARASLQRLRSAGYILPLRG